MVMKGRFSDCAEEKERKKMEPVARIKPAAGFLVNSERTNLNFFSSAACISVFEVCDAFVLHTGFIQWLSGISRQQLITLDIHTFAHY